MITDGDRKLLIAALNMCGVWDDHAYRAAITFIMKDYV